MDLNRFKYELSVSLEVCDSIVSVFFFLLLFEIFFEIAHLKEVLEFLSSEWVVSIFPGELRPSELWFLNVPENVVWNSIENSLLLGLRQA
jgi:hypothetical protein